MKTIQDRGYVEKLGRALSRPQTGMVVSGWLEGTFPRICERHLHPPRWRKNLDEIARGERGYTETLRAFYGPFEEGGACKDKLPKATSLGDAPMEFSCPLCGSPMENKLGRGGIFVSCKNILRVSALEAKRAPSSMGDEPIGNRPETGAPVYVKTGRFGPYVEMALQEESTKHEARSTKKNLNQKGKGRPKTAAKRASIPAGTDLSQVTLVDAVKYLSLPRELESSLDRQNRCLLLPDASGPYVGSDGEFRSLKVPWATRIPSRSTERSLSWPNQEATKGC